MEGSELFLDNGAVIPVSRRNQKEVRKYHHFILEEKIMSQATINQVYTGMELCSNLVEAWLCYHYIGIFLPDRIRGRLPFFSSVPCSWWAL